MLCTFSMLMVQQDTKHTSYSGLITYCIQTEKYKNSFLPAQMLLLSNLESKHLINIYIFT
jgi:hypothetical protein